MPRARPESMPAPAGYVRRRVQRYRDGRLEPVEDAVAEEVPVAMVYDDVPFAVMMLTPLDLEDFALGFSLSEGMARSADDVRSVEVRPRLEGIELAVELAAGAPGRGRREERLLPGRSGCGLCGARTLEDAVRHPPPVGEGPRIDTDVLQRALGSMRAAQSINAATGSVHAAAWCDRQGRIVTVREDVGRHNALDKLIGAMLRAGTDPLDGFVVVTSRASYEMVTKAASAGVALMAAISAPTALAIGLAQETGLTLVGFARAGSHVVYTHPQRLLHPAGASA